MTKKPEAVKEVDLIKRKDGLCYKKYTRGGPFTGKRKIRFSGKSWKEDNWKKGKLHGPYKIYEPAKRKHLQIFVKGNFKNGKLHGLCEQYHNNGKLHFSTHYNKDKLEGPYKIFYKNGQLSMKTNYTNGKLHGVQWNYFDDGSFANKYKFKNGKELIKYRR